MFVGVDDTDSMKGNCTTFLAMEIIREFSDLDLIGNPRLVRLNPATPWKTRGNGSLILRFGRGVGEKVFIGEIAGKPLYCYPDCDEWEPDARSMLERIEPLVRAHHEDDSDPGVVLSEVRPDHSFYIRGVTTIMERSDIEAELDRIGAIRFEMGCGRGVIGSTCGMAWIPADSTFELLTYRPEGRWGTERVFDPLSIRDMDHSYPTTFNSWEDREQKVAMVPATPCPVMYGLRGDDPSDLIEASKTIRTEPIERWAVFLTNQGTDDHIIYDAEALVPNQSYYIEGTVTGGARHIPGSHVFIDFETSYGMITCGAYEPSKEFRMLFDWLVPGDRIGVMGELRDSPRTLNAEKVHVISLADDIRKVSNPVCPSCGRKMDSIGKGQGYRCRPCHMKAAAAVTEKETRWVVPGWYEPPTAARRHLSKPLKRMGLEQPVEFVNSRT